MRADLVDTRDLAAVVATVGTTSFASVDPVRELAAVAHEAGAWLHVDAAYAGSAWVCEEERWSQDGVELADSVVVNPHKWLLVPMDCSLLWTSRPEEFREVFTLTPEYLRTPRGRVRALRLRPRARPPLPLAQALGGPALLRPRGHPGDPARARPAGAACSPGWVDAEPGWELVAPQRFSLVVFRRDGSDEQNEALMERVNRSGEIFLSHTRLAGGSSCASRSGTLERRRTTSASPGTSYEGRPRNADHDRERPARLRDRRDARRGVRADRALAQHRLAVRRGPEVDPRRRAQGHDEGPDRQPRAGDPAHGRGGEDEGRRRDRRDALRHLRDGLELDGDLRVRHGCAHTKL